MRRTGRVHLSRLGALAFLFYAVHAGNHLLHRRPEEVIWACHVATLLIGIGLLGRWPRPVAVGVSWQVLGDSFWALDLLTGGEFILTSPLTHVGGLVLGLYGVRRLGFPAGTWWRAVLGLEALRLLTRLLAPRRSNVNLAFDIYTGWEKVYPSYLHYWAALVLLGAAVFFAIEQVARQVALKTARQAARCCGPSPLYGQLAG